MDETTRPDSGATGANPPPPGGRFDRAKEFVGDKYAAASGAVRDKYNTVREKVEDVDFGALTDKARDYVRSNPGKALLLSLGVGFVVGLLLRRDDDDD